MSLNDTPLANRVHIGIFGRTNAGKSSIINALTGQETALVSDIAGTTTDPVSKTMELLPLGPVVFIDTPGIDDAGALGRERIRRSMQILEKIDMALIVADCAAGLGGVERDLAKKLDARGIAYLTVYNKADLLSQNKKISCVFIRDDDTLCARRRNGNLPRRVRGKHKILPLADMIRYIQQHEKNLIYVSAKTGENINALREQIAGLTLTAPPSPPLISDFLEPGDIVVLVTPIDGSAPKGRLILPQQQVIRDILDAEAQAFITKEDGLGGVLKSLSSEPALVVTDSQVFKQVSKDTPENIPLTSFSILFARRKGILGSAIASAKVLDGLADGDCVLISEGCAHHRQCDDIGTVKLPLMISEYTGRKFRFEFTSGGSFPEELDAYSLIVHCGGCMLNERAMRHRLLAAKDAGIPMTNYGIIIAHMSGILERSIALFNAL